MTNSELLRLLRAIDGHNQKVGQILARIRDSGRADAEKLWRDLCEQCHSFAWAEHVGGPYLGESYVNEGSTYRRITRSNP